MKAAYRPRKLDTESLVRALVEEHRVMDAGLRSARDAASKGDFGGARQALAAVDPVFRQHIADEEATILGLLIRTLGAKEADEEIRVFRQHRPIYELMKKIDQLSSMSSVELEANQESLQALFREHTAAEEQRVFPRALALSKTNERKPQRA